MVIRAGSGDPPGSRRGLPAPLVLALLLAVPGALIGQQRTDPPDDDEAVRSASVEALLRRARQAATRAELATDDETRHRWATEAERFARATLHLDADEPEAHYFLGAAFALRITGVGNRDKISLGVAAHRAARRVLDIDPDHPGAHQLIGRLHMEVMSTSWIVRLVGGGMGMGELLDEASWESARTHLTRAVELEPDNPKHRLELAKVHRKMGEEEDARRLLREVAAGTGETELEAHHRSEARALLEEMKG